MKRIYETLLDQHLKHYSQMVFLAGPRQVGKTTISLTTATLTDQFFYFNWDNLDHKKVLIAGPKKIADFIGLDTLATSKPIIVFDELHKYRKWKNLLKGFFDTYKNSVKIIVTGSSKLDIYRTGGDSLMGRYFPYRIDPLTVAECIRTTIDNKDIQSPKQISAEQFNQLFEFGGFPEPFLNASETFSRRWKRLRHEQLFREDIRDISRIQEIAQLEILAELLKHQAGQLVNYSNLANKVNVSVDTIRRWIKTLNAFYYCFTIKPWTKNVTRSLLKEPKIYLWDWSDVSDVGLRSENFIAAHLLKAIHFWNDQGIGEYDLHFLRDKEKREVDFLVSKNKKPFILVEVKKNDSSLQRNLEIFQKQINAEYVLQVNMDLEYVNKSCFTSSKPMIVPARTFLSQLI